MSRRFINLITLLILITVLYAAYRYFVVPPAADEVAGVSVVDSEAAAGNSEFLELLLAMKNISLTKKIFDNPIFRDRLQDFSRPLPDRLVGRENPFAPLGVGSTGTTTISERRATTTTATTTAPRATTTRATPPTTPSPAGTSNNNLTDQEIQQFLQGDFNF